MIHTPKYNPSEFITRKGFTLVELMVAFAIIILMLSIMSQAFVIATNTMQGLKELAEMQEKIRPVLSLLQRDLSAYHFEGNKKLSDSNFWDNGPPKEGYFYLWQNTPYEPVTGPEPAGNENAFNGVSFRRSAAGANHMLSFTVKLPGSGPDDFFVANMSVPLLGAFPNVFFNNSAGTPPTPSEMKDSNIKRFETSTTSVHSRWAEVAYFLGPHNAGNFNPIPDGTTDGKSGLALPLFNLYRQQRLLLPELAGTTLPSIPDNAVNRDVLSDFSYHPYEINNAGPILKFNTPADLTVPWKRMGNRQYNNLGSPITAPLTPKFNEFTAVSNRYLTDIIATNVVSFDVRFLTDDRNDYEDLLTILSQPAYSTNLAVTNYATLTGLGTARCFDTWTTDQGGPAFPAGNLPIYDYGTYVLGKWAPTPPYNNLNPTRIPVWNTVSNTGLNVKAIQVSIRVWDQKSNSAKMFVVVQKL